MTERIPLLYDMVLRPEWIDFALEQWIRNPNEDEHRACLREYLSGRVKGQEALIKTASQLQRNVGPRSRIPQARLRSLYDEMAKLAPEERTASRLAILEESTPFFSDTVAAIRKLELVGVNEVPMRQLYERVAANTVIEPPSAVASSTFSKRSGTWASLSESDDSGACANNSRSALLERIRHKIKKEYRPWGMRQDWGF